MQIVLFVFNDISLDNTDPVPVVDPTTNTIIPTPISNTTNPSNPSNPSSPSNPSGTTNQTVPVNQQVIDEQTNHNSGYVPVDPNSIFYAPANNLINQDTNATSTYNVVLNMSNPEPTSVDLTIKYLRAEEPIIENAAVLRIIQGQNTPTVVRWIIYFFREVTIRNQPSFELYRAIVDYNKQTPENRFFVISFVLFAQNGQLVNPPNSVVDQSLTDDTDIAYGYTTVSLANIGSDPNIQGVLNYLNQRYKSVIQGMNVSNVETLKLLDGRINYKIVYSDPVTSSQYKFVVFYQPALQKVLVLNSINIPHLSQYNQLSSDQQKTDALAASVLSFINGLHPDLSGYTVLTVSKATESTFM